MAGERVNTYAQDDSDILALQLTTDKTFKGYHQLTLTEYDTTTVPAIAAGSAIECNGALYKFDTEEAISTTDPVTSATVADGTVYVCIIPDTTTATAAFTATAPTWSDSKQGWYGTGGQANYRYAEYIIIKTGSEYTGKTSIFRNNFDTFYYAEDATERSTTSTSRVDETNCTVTIPIKKGCIYEVFYKYKVKVSSASTGNIIWFGKTTIGNIKYIANSIYVNTSTGYTLLTQNAGDADADYTNNISTVYSERIYNFKFIALDTESYSFDLSWIAYSGCTVYIKERKVYIREIQGIVL